MKMNKILIFLLLSSLFLLSFVVAENLEENSIVSSPKANNLIIDLISPKIGYEILDYNHLWFMFNLSTDGGNVTIDNCWADLTVISDGDAIIQIKNSSGDWEMIQPIAGTQLNFTFNSNLTNTTAPLMVVNETPVTRIIPGQLPWTIAAGNCWVYNETNVDNFDPTNPLYVPNSTIKNACWYAWDSVSVYSWNLTCNVSNTLYLGGEGTFSYYLPSILSGPTSTETTSSVTINWITDKETTNHVIINSVVYTGNKDTSASVDVSGLSSSTNYNYEIVSCDSIGEQRFYRNSSTDSINCIRSSGHSFSTRSSGGGSTNTNTEAEVVLEVEQPKVCEWDCTAWSGCDENNVRIRTCSNPNNCDSDKPNVQRKCTISYYEDPVIEEENSNPIEQSSSGDEDLIGEEIEKGNEITGAVTGNASSKGWVWVASITGFILIAGIGINIYNRKNF